jgi:hypothetical protein
MKLFIVALALYNSAVYAVPESGIYDALEHVEVENREVGAKAEADFFSSMSGGDLWRASLYYRIADRNLHMNDISSLRSRAGEALEAHSGLDIGVLGFGWIDGFGDQRMGFFKRRDSVIGKLRSGASLTDEQVLAALKSPHNDVRPPCEAWKEVAQVFAEAQLWDRAVGLMDAHSCNSDSQMDQYRFLSLKAMGNSDVEAKNLALLSYRASLIGYASMGVKARFSPNDKDVVGKIVKYTMSLLGDQSKSPLGSFGSKSVELQAAIVSLVENVTEKFSKTEPTGKAYLSKEERSFEKLVVALNKVDSLRTEFRPNIEEAYREWKQADVESNRLVRGKKDRDPFSYYWYSQALHQYYKKYENPWQAWRWLQEAYFSRPSRGHNAVWTRDSYSMIHRRAYSVAYHLMGKDYGGKNALEVMLDKLSTWFGQAIPRPRYQTYHKHIREPEYLKWVDSQVKKEEVVPGRLERDVWTSNKALQPKLPAQPSKVDARASDLQNRMNIWKQNEKTGRQLQAQGERERRQLGR